MNRRQWMKGAAAGLMVGTAHAAQVSKPGGNSAMQAPQTSAQPAALSWKKVLPGIWKVRFGVPEAYTPVSSRTVPPLEIALARLPSVETPPVAVVTGQVTARGCLLQMPLAPEEEIYGFGLQMLSFAQRGKKKTIRVNADPKVDTGDSHAPVPFFVSTRGYGLLVDSCRQVEFFCGNARLRPKVPRDPRTPPADSTRRLPMDAAGSITIETPRTGGVEAHLFAGPSMLNAVQRYNLFSGGGVEPPEWGLGFWYRAEGQADQQAVLNLVREFRDRNIPCDVLGLEPGWQSHSYSCTFVWDQARFPDPQALMRDTSRLDYRINLWEHAFTYPTSPLFSPLLPCSGNYGVWGGLVPDFAGKPARDIFGGYHGRNLIDRGIAGFKLDECDNSDFTGGWSFPDFSQFPSGVDGEQMHAVFGLRYQEAIWQQFQQRNRPTYGLVRSSGALAAPCPFVLYSDLYDHRVFVRALVNSGFAGLLWCPEVRDARSEEDLVRRLETVVFSPLAMVNAWYIKNPPWKQIDRDLNNAGRFSPGWEALEARCRTIVGWRMQLIPYLRGAFARYAIDGTPPFRALILDYPEDERLRTVDDEYMVGDRMLVAPLFAGESERRILLPRGTWHNFWTGARVEGGSSFSVSASAKEIPVFVKAGSVLPLAAVGASTQAPESRDLTVQVYGDGSLPWRMQGEDALELQWRPSTRDVTIRQPGNRPGRYRVTGSRQVGNS